MRSERRLFPMKTLTFLTRRPDLDRESFVDYWLTTHAPLASRLDGLRKYATCPALFEDAVYDGIAELHFDSEAALLAVLGPESDTDAIRDVDEFIDSMRRYLVEETVRFDDLPGNGPGGDGSGGNSPDGDAPVKYVAVHRRRPDLDADVVRERWPAGHVDVVRRLPGLRRYVTSVPLDPDGADFDGVSELYFDDADALDAALGPTHEYDLADADRLFDGAFHLATVEHVQVERS